MMDPTRVLTAMHLVDGKEEDAILPIDYKTIAKLERDYGSVGFDWEGKILPQIKSMIRDLFSGMTEVYPEMSGSASSRALYGVDVMFEVEDDEGVLVRLTEVAFCPSNNAICDSYERDEQLYRDYNTEVFECLFLGTVADSLSRLD